VKRYEIARHGLHRLFVEECALRYACSGCNKTISPGQVMASYRYSSRNMSDEYDQLSDSMHFRCLEKRWPGIQETARQRLKEFPELYKLVILELAGGA